MSRVSLNSRLRAILDAAERIDPLVAQVHRLPPALRIRYDNWRAECERRIAEAVRESGPGAAYAAMLDGSLMTPEPSREVAGALGLNDAIQLFADLSAADVAETWARMVED